MTTTNTQEDRTMSAIKAIAVAALTATFAALGAASGHADYYKGKTVTVIVPNSPTGPMVQWARMIGPYLQKALGARDVRIDAQPGAASLRGTNLLWNAKTDGLTVGFTNIPTFILAQLAGSQGVQFDTARFAYLGSVADDPRVLSVNPKIKSIEEVLAFTRPFNFPTQGTDEDFYTMAVTFHALGVKLKPITGYVGDPDTNLAILKGEGDGHMTSWNTSMAPIKAGEKRPILHMGETPYPGFPDVPTALQIVKDPERQKPLRTIMDILSVTRGYFGPPNMNATAVDEFRAALATVGADAALKDEAQKRGFFLAFYNGNGEQDRIKRVMAGSTNLTPILKAALESIR
jgi:tripartite-type tricarboxylate transporter receptor subunit TctC